MRLADSPYSGPDMTSNIELLVVESVDRGIKSGVLQLVTDREVYRLCVMLLGPHVDGNNSGIHERVSVAVMLAVESLRKLT